MHFFFGGGGTGGRWGENCACALCLTAALSRGPSHTNTFLIFHKQTLLLSTDTHSIHKQNISKLQSLLSGQLAMFLVTWPVIMEAEDNYAETPILLYKIVNFT